MEEMKELAGWMDGVAQVRADKGLELDDRKAAYAEVAAEGRARCERFPAPGLRYGEDGRPV